MSLMKELQDINKWLDELIWEVNKFNEYLEDFNAKYSNIATSQENK